MEHLVRFWLEVAKAKWSGVLDGWGADDIEAAADWEGNSGEFCRAMAEVGMLEQREGVWCVHDWEVHQPFVASWEDRRAKKVAAGKRSAEVRKETIGTAQPNRWPNTSKQTPNTCSEVVRTDSEHFRTDPTPCPSPIPNPKIKIKTSSSPSATPPGFEEFWNSYPRRNGIKVGKADAAKAYNREIKSEGDHAALMRAVSEYAARCGDLPKDAHRWLRSWRDCLDVKEGGNGNGRTRRDDGVLSAKEIAEMAKQWGREERGEA